MVTVSSSASLLPVASPISCSSAPEFLRSPKPICSLQLVSATRYALFTMVTRGSGANEHRAAQSSAHSAQSYGYGPTSQHSPYVSPQQQTTHLKSANWKTVSDVHNSYKPNQATTHSSLYSPPPQTAYDPYKPLATSNAPAQPAHDLYKSQVQQTPVHMTHDPYKPVVQTSSSTQSRPTPAYGALNSYPSAYPKPPVPPVPMPPRVVAESFRTNNSNAYDPPMLPTKPKRHASGWGSTITPSTHVPPLPPPSPTVSNTQLVPPPRRDSVASSRTNTSSAEPPPRNVDSPTYRSRAKSPGLPPPPSRPSSRQVLQGAGFSHSPLSPPSSRQLLKEPPAPSPQQHGYTHQRVDSPNSGTLRNVIGSPESTTVTSGQSLENLVPELEQPSAVQDPETPFDSYDDPEASAVDADKFPSIANANTSPGLSWDRPDGPSPSTARQSDYTTPQDDEVGDMTITDTHKPEPEPVASHSRASSYDRLHANDKLAPPKQAVPQDPYKPTSSTVKHPPSASHFVPTPTQAASSSYDPYKPTVSSTPGSVPTPSSPPVNGSRPGSLRSSLESTRPYISQHDYAPPVRTSSPASIRSQPGTYVSSALKLDHGSSTHDPYTPSNRTRSATSGTISSVTSDPYTPRRQSSEAQDRTPYSSKFGYPDRPSSRTETLLTSSTYPTYAPSPSLLGTNDPLGRSSARVPVISFGFGGKVVTCFHGADMSSAGFDVALSSRQSREIHLRSLHKIIPQSALEDTTVVYPGPLFGDSGSPTVSLVRGASTQAKTKKAKVVKYLEDRISELSNVVAYSSTGLLERGRSEGKLALFSLLKVMVENDGKLSGT